jgi:hypothetical protein
MTKRISPVAIDALKDALSSVFWFKDDLRSFLANAVDDPKLLSGIDWHGNYKRASVNQFVDRLAKRQETYGGELLQLMSDVASMDDFPKLERAEDRELKIEEAREAVGRLRKQIEPYEEQLLKQAENAERIRRD